jgi:hypothetical protein
MVNHLTDEDRDRLRVATDDIWARASEATKDRQPRFGHKQITANDLLLAGWHCITDELGVWWAYPVYWARGYRFKDAVRMYRAGARDE